jgi:hypothetical protein
MQVSTTHLDLDFDVNTDLLRGGRKVHVTDYAFLHVGRCIDVTTLKDFMRSNSVDFSER